jgi:short-subunit dehydrogenase
LINSKTPEGILMSDTNKITGHASDHGIGKSGTALITGASTGIGATYAKRLARRGYDLILVARSKPNLDELAKSLTAEFAVRVQTLPADLTVEADLARVEAILKNDSSITLLVNNAGSATLGALAGADIGRLGREIQLNIVAPTRLSHAALPGFLSRKRGGLINIASVMSQMLQPGNSVYGATKSYLLHFSEVLALELGGSGIRVQVVLPGATRTALWNGSGVELKDLPADIVMEVDEMVDAALAGFDQGERVTIPSLPDPADWQRLVKARETLQPNLSRKHAAPRYKVPLAAAV